MTPESWGQRQVDQWGRRARSSTITTECRSSEIHLPVFHSRSRINSNYELTSNWIRSHLLFPNYFFTLEMANVIFTICWCLLPSWIDCCCFNYFFFGECLLSVPFVWTALLPSLSGYDWERNLWTEDVAQSVEGLPRIHEDLSLTPSISRYKQCVCVRIHI